MAWSRNEKIGFWSLLVAVISCAAAIASIPPRDRDAAAGAVSEDTVELVKAAFSADPDAVRLELERRAYEQRLRDERVQIARDENRRLHESRVDLRRERITALTHELDAKGSPAYHAFGFRNQCSLPIFVAAYYRDLDGLWVTTGWWKVQPGEETLSFARSTNSIVYLFAESEGRRVTWSGEGKAGALRKTVTNPGFYMLDGETNPYDKTVTETFFRVDLPESFGTYMHGFTCSTLAH